MNLFESMRYLAALHRHRHFGHAAQALHITQPGLSNAIRAMEEELGVAIVRRGRRYEGLTREGELVLAAAHRMLREQEVLRQELSAARRQPEGSLVVGSVPTAVPVAARFAARLRARHPGLTIMLRSLSLTEIESGIDELGIDVGFGYVERPRRTGAERLKVVRQYDERYYVLRQVPGTARGQRRIGAPIRWRDAAVLPLAVLAPEMYHHRALVDAAFARAGVQPRHAIETNALLALMVSVQTGDVCSVLPGSLATLALQIPGMQARPLVEPDVVTSIGLLSLGDAAQSLAHRAALALARDEAWLREAVRHGSLAR